MNVATGRRGLGERRDRPTVSEKKRVGSTRFEQPYSSIFFPEMVRNMYSRILILVLVASNTASTGDRFMKPFLHRAVT